MSLENQPLVSNQQTMAEPAKKDGKQALDTLKEFEHLSVTVEEEKTPVSIQSTDGNEEQDGIQFSMNVKHTVEKMKKETARKIMIAMDNSPFSKKAIDWVYDNLLRADDHILLISMWEEGMVNKFVNELDAALIHPEVAVTPSHSGQKNFNNIFHQADCFKDQKKLTALLVEAGARINTKTIGEELCDYAEQMGINILVCGTRGLGGIKKAFLGSVSTYVASNCKCTNIIVK